MAQRAQQLLLLLLACLQAGQKGGRTSLQLHNAAKAGAAWLLKAVTCISVQLTMCCCTSQVAAGCQAQSAAALVYHDEVCKAGCLLSP
jgi:hypothetical protein